MAMAENLVFITGATGHVGFKTLVVALQAGYPVRAAVRSDSKKLQILSTPSIKALNPGSKLSFMVVPDLTVEGAYDEAVKGAAYIIHIASPVVLKREIKQEDYQTELIEPAVAGTVSVLKAAAKTTGVKRVVITSSIVALLEAKWLFDLETPEGMVIDHNSRTPFPAAPYPTDFHAYNASKIAALEATSAFVRDGKPKFDVININPSFVVGKNELANDLKEVTAGTNGIAFGVVLGNKLPYPIFGGSVHVDDVAFMHVKALDAKIPAGTYIASSDGYTGTTWQNATRIVSENYPEAVAKGIFVNNGTQETRRGRIDATKSEEVFGFRFLTFEDQVKSIASHYLELLGEKAT